MKLISKCSLLLLLGICFTAPVIAQTAQQPVVKAVLFTMKRCPDCDKLKNEMMLPAIQAKYGNRLQIMTVDITEPTGPGRKLFNTAMDWLNVPQAGDQRRVPALIIGKTRLTGSNEIVSRLPGMVEEGLQMGGIDAPAIPGMGNFSWTN